MDVKEGRHRLLAGLTGQEGEQDVNRSTAESAASRQACAKGASRITGFPNADAAEGQPPQTDRRT